MKTLFITCLYSKLEGSILGGRASRLGRQIASLHGLLQMNADFVCFTSAAEVDMLRKEFRETNIRFIEYNLESNPQYTRLRQIQNPEAQRKCDRCQDIQQMKFSWHETLDLSSYTHVYWIDAGLSSTDLMKDYNSTVWLSFLNYVPNKILALGKENENFFYAQWPSHNFRRIDKQFVIGGLVGGPTHTYIEQCKRMQTLIQSFLDANECPQEEVMMNTDQSNHSELYQLQVFDIWEAHDPRAKTNICFLDMMRRFVHLEPLILSS